VFISEVLVCVGMLLYCYVDIQIELLCVYREA